MKKYIIFFLMLLYVPLVLGLSIEKFEANHYIAYDKVVAEYSIIFGSPSAVSGEFFIPIPKDAAAISIYQDEKLLPYQKKEQHISVNLENATKLKLSYVTNAFLEPDKFLMNFKAPYNTKLALISLTLPEYASLLKPVTETSGSVYPRPADISSDGVSITITWRAENLPEGEEIPIYVLYKEQFGITGWIWIIAILVMLLLIPILFFIRKRMLKKKPKEEETEREDVKKAEAREETIPEKIKMHIFRHLKEDEQQIVNILKQREGQCEQGTLRVITGFSKAKLSSLLSELEERNIVYKEKRGKKNLVFLRE